MGSKLIIGLFLATVITMITQVSARVTIQYCPTSDIIAYAGSRDSASVTWEIPRAYSDRPGVPPFWTHENALYFDTHGRQRKLPKSSGLFHTGTYRASPTQYVVQYVWCDEPLLTGCAGGSCCAWCTFNFRVQGGSNPADPCLTAPCLNGGACNGFAATEGRDRAYTCTCPSRYTGDNCQTLKSDTVPPTLSCPPDQTAMSEIANEPYRVEYPSATSSPGVTITYNNPSGNYFPYGTTTVYVTGVDINGNVGRCTFRVIVTAGESVSLSPGQMNEFMDNYGDLLNDVPMSNGMFDNESIAEPQIYGRQILGLTQVQQNLLLQRYPDLFVQEHIAIPRDRQRRQTPGQPPVPSRICESYFPPTTMLVTISGTDSNHAGYVGQLARANDRIQWAFNEECALPYCTGVNQMCSCFKERRTVSALIYNIQAAGAMGSSNVPLQWKQVHIYSCRGGL
ncbi:uncharacterized protein [Amphiura filiformis]|uniref:uncharacterized protein n=1 Tax=Amphiura filiformis TaxID=82378 RepID=UPI003B226832